MKVTVPAPKTPEAAPVEGRSRRRSASGHRGNFLAVGWAALARQVNVFGMLFLIAATWTIFGIAGSGFLGSFNMYSVGQIAARDAVLGMAQALLVVIARMNLGIGSIGAICASLLGYMMVDTSIPLPLQLLIVCVTAVLASLLMGWAELRTGLSSFIVTLAFLSIYGGGALLVTRGQSYTIMNSVINRLGSGTFLFGSICPLVPIAVICGVLLWFLYFRSSLGWKMLSVGANVRAARASGVNVSRVIMWSYGISGLLVAVAATMNCAYQLNVNAGVGADFLLPSFIAPVLGGVALVGGGVTVGGIMLAAVFYDSLQSGLTILNVPTYWTELAQGLVLLVAVVLNQLRMNRRGRSRRSAPTDATSVEKEEEVAVV